MTMGWHRSPVPPPSTWSSLLRVATRRGARLLLLAELALLRREGGLLPRRRVLPRRRLLLAELAGRRVPAGLLVVAPELVRVLVLPVRHLHDAGLVQVHEDRRRGLQQAEDQQQDRADAVRAAEHEEQHGQQAGHRERGRRDARLLRFPGQDRRQQEQRTDQEQARQDAAAVEVAPAAVALDTLGGVRETDEEVDHTEAGGGHRGDLEGTGLRAAARRAAVGRPLRRLLRALSRVATRCPAWVGHRVALLGSLGAIANGLGDESGSPRPPTSGAGGWFPVGKPVGPDATPASGPPSGRLETLSSACLQPAFATSRRASSAVSVGVLPTRTPPASRASFLACAVPDEPDTIAPAWPIVLPSGAVKPAT